MKEYGVTPFFSCTHELVTYINSELPTEVWGLANGFKFRDRTVVFLLCIYMHAGAGGGGGRGCSPPIFLIVVHDVKIVTFHQSKV